MRQKKGVIVYPDEGSTTCPSNGLDHDMPPAGTDPNPLRNDIVLDPDRPKTDMQILDSFAWSGKEPFSCRLTVSSC